MSSPKATVEDVVQAGSVSIYTADETGTFVQEGIVTMPQPAVDDQLGYSSESLSMTSEYIACGARYVERVMQPAVSAVTTWSGLLRALRLASIMEKLLSTSGTQR